MRSTRLTLLLAFATAAAHAEVTGFRDSHMGVLIGGGTWFHLLPSLDKWNPVPDLAPDGLTITGSDDYYLLPLKLGIFKDLPGRSFIELWGRYVINTSNSWTTSDGTTGSTKWSSIGGGFATGFNFFVADRFRMQIVANTEYIIQRVKITHSVETLNVRTSSILAGGGLQMELWAVDTWVVSLFGGYQYGFPSPWTAAADGVLFGEAYTGTLASPLTGDDIVARNGGVLVEATFKLVMK